MGSCRALNCTTRSHVNATTDIAGSGVLAAFLASALLTVLAIVYGYLSDSLPEWYLNETDKTIISGFQSWLPSDQTRQKSKSVWTKIKLFILQSFGAKPLRISRPLSRLERQEALTRFILALSDQQLATGLAILVAATANQCELSVWEFQVAFALAWFSSTTHLATLDVLRDYFIGHGVVRNWRVLGMVALMTLLSYALLMAMASIDETIPVQCTFEYFGDIAPDSHDPISIYLVISAALTLAFLLWNYGVRILWSYRNANGRASTLERLVFNLRTRKMRRKYKPTGKELKYIIKEAVIDRDSRGRRTELEDIMREKGWRRHLLIWKRSSRLYSESFLSTGPLLVFMVSYGFTQLYNSRWHTGAPVSVDQSMNFGQITPLFLLILPVFSAAEIYYEVKDNSRPGPIAKDNSFPSTTSSATGTEGTSPRLNSLPAEDRDLEHANQLYDRVLLEIKRFYYSEAKAIQHESNSATTESAYKAALIAKSTLLSRFQSLQSAEQALTPTILFAMLEFTLCSVACLALGILLNVEDPRASSTLASVVLLGLYLIYTIAGFTAQIHDAWKSPSQEEYARLLKEAKLRLRTMDGEAADGEAGGNEDERQMTPVSSYTTAAEQPATGSRMNETEKSMARGINDIE